MTAYLLVDGRPHRAELTAADRLVFRLQMPPQEIRLVSGFARPAVLAASGDQRHLGVALYSLRWQQGQTEIDIPITLPSFLDGFYHVEHEQPGQLPYRWTNGNAAVPPDAVPPWRGQALLHVNLKTWTGSAAPAPSNPSAATLRRFDSLGTNCELALAQRHYGVELPLGLLRWSGTTYPQLLNGLETRFDRLGDPATTQVLWGTTDYRLHTPYLRMHTTTIEHSDEAAVAEILTAGCATLRLLRRKLLSDIAEARRIFVFASPEQGFGQPEMRRLYAALRRIGPASLLCVTQRSGGHGVERLADGLYAGYLDRFVIPDGPFDGWLHLCARTLLLHDTP